MAAQPDKDVSRQSDLAVMDANEYKQKRRLERILDAMDNIEEQANKAWDEFVHGEINHDAKNIMIQRAVKEAIRESYNLLLDHHESVNGEAKENGEDAKGSEYWVGRGNQPLGTIEQVSQDNIVILGLRDFLNTKEFYIEEWDEIDDGRHGAPEKITQKRKQSVPERVSWMAALRLKQFLNDVHGLELSFETIEIDEHADPF